MLCVGGSLCVDISSVRAVLVCVVAVVSAGCVRTERLKTASVLKVNSGIVRFEVDGGVVGSVRVGGGSGADLTHVSRTGATSAFTFTFALTAIPFVTNDARSAQRDVRRVAIC